jgi:hypothetical protein
MFNFNIKNKKLLKKLLNLNFNGFVLSIILILIGCSPKLDPVTGKNEVFEPNAYERASQYAKGNPVFFGDKSKKDNNFEFSTSNVLWRSTLKSLEFLPLMNADYSGGIIIYDWYSESKNPKEQVKISVQFLSNELRSDSIKITAHKKICDNTGLCSNSTLDQKFANSIKSNIIDSARALRIEEAKKEKK